MPHQSLGDAFYFVNFIDDSTKKVWTISKTNYDKLRNFVCKVYTLIPKDDGRKLEPRSRKYVFLGYGPDDEIGYRL